MHALWQYEFIRYLACNIPGTIVYYAVFISLGRFVGNGRIQLQWWAFIASVLGFAINFPFFRYLTFGYTTLDGIGRHMIQYLPLAIVCTLLNGLMLDYFARQWKMRWLSAQLAAGGIVIFSAYIIGKYQIFA